MLPDLESLRCFHAAATAASFRAAAREVALSPAAFGDRIRRLEEQLDAPLFARTTRRVALTAAGARLLPHARELLAAAAACRRVAHATQQPAPYALTIGTRFELGLSWLVPALPALARRRPARTVHLVFGDSPDLLARARAGGLDAVVTSARFAARDLAFAVLHDEHYVFVASRRLARARPLARPADAAAHALLDIAPELPLFRYFLDAARARASWQFARVEYLGTIAAIRQRVLQGAGVAVLPRYFVQRDLAAGRLVPLVPRVVMAPDAFRLVWRAGHAHAEELQGLAEELAALPLR